VQSRSLIYKDDLKKLDDVEVKEKYQVEISNRFAALESLDEILDTNNACVSITENIKTSAKENLVYHRLKHNESWFDDVCSKLIDQMKQVTLQLLQDPSQINGNRNGSEDLWSKIIKEAKAHKGL
jgi:hypothetical protein